MTTDSVAQTPTIEDAVSTITRYLKPGFVEEWRRLTLALGYGRLGRTLCGITITEEPSTNGYSYTPKRTASRRKEPCIWGRNFTRSGNITRNTRHNCGPECSWSYREALDWAAETPYHYQATGSHQSVLTECASCLCGLPLHFHSVPASRDGKLSGMHHQKCEFESREAVAPNL